MRAQHCKANMNLSLIEPKKVAIYMDPITEDTWAMIVHTQAQLQIRPANMFVDLMHTT